MLGVVVLLTEWRRETYSGESTWKKEHGQTSNRFHSDAVLPCFGSDALRGCSDRDIREAVGLRDEVLYLAPAVPTNQCQRQRWAATWGVGVGRASAVEAGICLTRERKWVSGKRLENIPHRSARPLSSSKSPPAATYCAPKSPSDPGRPPLYVQTLLPPPPPSSTAHLLSYPHPHAQQLPPPRSPPPSPYASTIAPSSTPQKPHTPSSKTPPTAPETLARQQKT